MNALLYIRLIGYTAGTLLLLFWMVVILGYRRQRNFERVFFFLCLALFLFYGGSLLELNAQIHYVTPPAAVQVFAATLLLIGLCLVPPILVHMHFEYASTRGLVHNLEWKRILIAAAYAPLVYFGLKLYPLLASGATFDLLAPGRVLGLAYGAWLAGAMLVAFWWEVRFEAEAPTRPERTFHKQLAKFFLLVGSLVLIFHIFQEKLSVGAAADIGTTVAVLTLVPFAVMLWLVLKYNFLNIGRQKNLVYAVSVTFLALLYLSLVRRVSGRLEPVLPPEATAAILLFLLVVFIEPLQRVLGRSLKETAQLEMDRVQKLMAEIQQEARQGNVVRFVSFIERRIREQLELREVRLTTAAEQSGHLPGPASEPRAALAFDSREFPILREGKREGVLLAEPHGAVISGDTRAALEFLCEQLPGALDLCRLIEEKLRLERELAERERLALVGQMAASISHNLKNPLGSMKTILQVQLENPELPDSIRGETKMVLEEIGRLSTKLNQLLQFSRPAVRRGDGTGSCDVAAVVEEVAGVLSHEAERRGLQLRTGACGVDAQVAVSAEALNDIVSNLVVNALEATPRGGHVTVSATRENGSLCVIIEDDGPGIPAALRDKVLQPFFTTKSQGTGLGLAIVARRVAEFRGKVDWESPTANGHGTRFKVTLPIQEARK
jgi:signal transduction histidine kinase